MSGKITFRFHPYEFRTQGHAVEKSENGIKRRYLYGISSGIMKDGHGERMTMECIKDMHDQAQRGDICLYCGLHGIDFTRDIGILSESNVDEKGSWVTGYRLYDESDNMGPDTMTVVDKVWRRVNGLAPYRVPQRLGFSIEGNVPDGSIEKMDLYGKRTIGKVDLEGVVLVTNPAVQESVATAVYKFLGELPPESEDRLRNRFKSRLSERVEKDNMKRDFYDEKYAIESLFEDEVRNVLKQRSIDRIEERLGILFDEYKSAMIPLHVKHVELFTPDESVDSAPVESSVAKEQIFAKLSTQFRKLHELSAIRVAKSTVAAKAAKERR